MKPVLVSAKATMPPVLLELPLAVLLVALLVLVLLVLVLLAPAPPVPVLLEVPAPPAPPAPVVAVDVSVVVEVPVELVVSLLEHAVREATPSVIARKAVQNFMTTTLSRGRREEAHRGEIRRPSRASSMVLSRAREHRSPPRRKDRIP
jgi:hypothetical protein